MKIKYESPVFFCDNFAIVYEIDEKKYPEYIEFIKSGKTDCSEFFFKGKYKCDLCPFQAGGTIPRINYCLDKPFYHIKNNSLKITILEDKIELFD